jgi:hypothetical protein
VTENSVIHIERSEKSVIYIDRTAESMWMTEFSLTYIVLVLQQCTVYRYHANKLNMRKDHVVAFFYKYFAAGRMSIPVLE